MQWNTVNYRNTYLASSHAVTSHHVRGCPAEYRHVCNSRQRTRMCSSVGTDKADKQADVSWPKLYMCSTHVKTLRVIVVNSYSISVTDNCPSVDTTHHVHVPALACLWGWAYCIAWHPQLRNVSSYPFTRGGKHDHDPRTMARCIGSLVQVNISCYIIRRPISTRRQNDLPKRSNNIPWSPLFFVSRRWSRVVWGCGFDQIRRSFSPVWQLILPGHSTGRLEMEMLEFKDLARPVGMLKSRPGRWHPLAVTCFV